MPPFGDTRGILACPPLPLPCLRPPFTVFCVPSKHSQSTTWPALLRGTIGGTYSKSPCCRQDKAMLTMSFSMKRCWERSNHCTNLRGLHASHYLQSHRCIGAALLRTANLMSFCLNITTRGPRQGYCLACRFVGKHVVFHIDVQGGRSRGKETCKNLVSKQSSFDIVGRFQTKQF